MGWFSFFGGGTRVVEAHRDLEVNHLLCECGHFIVEAEAVFTNALGREHKVSLTLLGAI